MTAVASPPGQPTSVDDPKIGARYDGTDQSALLNAITTPGAYTIAAGNLVTLTQPLVLKKDVWFSCMPGGGFRWAGASNVSMFSQSTAGLPTIRTGVVAPHGHGVIDLTLATGVTVFDLHSPQYNRYEGLDILAAADQTGTVFKIACDVATAGGYGGASKNAHKNRFANLVIGKNGTTFSAAGTVAATQCVTLNNFEDIDVTNQGVAFMVLGPFFDSNTFKGTIRASLNQNNAIGLDLGYNGGAGDAFTYNNFWETLVADTFVIGKTGRIGIRLGLNTSRNRITKFFNNPAAEGGQIIDAGCLSCDIVGDWVSAAGATSSIQQYKVGIATLSRFQTVAYSASITPNMRVLGDGGTFAITATDANATTINLPTNLSTGNDFEVLWFNNTAGAMGNITWAGNWRMGTFTKPAAGQRNAMRFRVDAGGFANAISAQAGPY